LAVHRLRRRVREFEIVHAWGARALTAAAFSGARRVVFSPVGWPTRRQVRWLRSVMSHRDVNVVCPSATLHRALVERGVAIERCHLIRPGVDFSRLRGGREEGLRERLGLEREQEVWLLPGESEREADHRMGVWAATIVNILNRRTRVLTWGRGPLAGAVAEFAADLGQPELFVAAEARLGRRVEFEELLPAADVMVVSATGPVSTLAIATGMAAGLPSVAGVTATVAELLEDRHTALMTKAGVPRLLAKRVLDLKDDAGLRWSLVDRARTEAYEYFSLTRFLEEYRATYRRLA
jgi:glycosyltransferase involved in cell wall biosynthesis